MSGPFLLPVHTDPLPSFWNEWWAGVLGLLAAVAGLFVARDRLRLTPLLIIPAALLTGILAQFLLGRLVFPQLGLLYAVYLLWAALLVVLGRHLADTIGLAPLADVLAVAFVLGGLLAAFAALAQWLGIGDHLPWVFSGSGNSVRANIGQGNHHAHYSWLGNASAFYLCGRKRISRTSLWFLILLIGFGSVLSGSRSVFLYPAVLLAAGLWAWHRAPRGLAPVMIADLVLLLPIIGALNFFGTWASPRMPEFWSWFAGLHPGLSLADTRIDLVGPDMPSTRLFESVSGFSPRMAILRTAWSVFVEHPWLGQGPGNYPWASFVASGSRTGEGPFLVGEHAHNLVLHLFAEFGAPVAIAVILVVAFWAKGFFQQSWRLEHLWCGAVLGMGAVHSLLEYPLWYSYFLGPTALLLGATETGRSIILTGRRIRVYLGVVALVGLLVLGNLRSDYSTLEAASNYPLAADADREMAWRISIERLIKLHHESLLSPWILMTFAILAEPSGYMAQDRADLCERGIRFSPARVLVTRCAMQFAIAGRNVGAQRLVQDVLRAFPAERATTFDELGKGARAHPEILSLVQTSLGS